jgi:hypothetical protein
MTQADLSSLRECDRKVECPLFLPLFLLRGSFRSSGTACPQAEAEGISRDEKTALLVAQAIDGK